MTKRELDFIHSAVRGLSRARRDLAGPDADSCMADVIEQLYDTHPTPLTNEEIAYMAAMVLAWTDRGSPDLVI